MAKVKHQLVNTQNIALGSSQLKKLDSFVENRREIAKQYNNLFSNIELIKLNEAKDIFPAYKKALEREDGKSTIVVEYGDYYNEK